MRRNLIVSLAILLLVAAVGGACEKYNADLTARYRRLLLPVETAMAREDWREAGALAQQICDRWQRESGWVQLWINHGDTDAVSHALRGLCAAIAQRDRLSAALYWGDCLENFAHLHHRDAFTLKNIL